MKFFEKEIKFPYELFSTQLSTQILNTENVPIDFSVKIYKQSNQYKVYIQVDDFNLNVGEMIATVECRHVWINRMYNCTITDPDGCRSIGILKGVGKTLFEIAFRISAKEGKNGFLELISTNSKDKTPEKFYNMGFLSKDDAFSKDFIDLVYSYWCGSKEDDLILLICTHHDYKDFKKNAIRFLKKLEDNISFEEIMSYGFCSKNNSLFETKRQNFRIQGRMFLPLKTVQFLFEKYLSNTSQDSLTHSLRSDNKTVPFLTL